jgi:hypothetical protein
MVCHCLRKAEGVAIAQHAASSDGGPFKSKQCRFFNCPHVCRDGGTRLIAPSAILASLNKAASALGAPKGARGVTRITVRLDRPATRAAQDVWSRHIDAVALLTGSTTGSPDLSFQQSLVVWFIAKAADESDIQ